MSLEQNIALKHRFSKFRHRPKNSGNPIEHLLYLYGRERDEINRDYRQNRTRYINDIRSSAKNVHFADFFQEITTLHFFTIDI